MHFRSSCDILLIYNECQIECSLWTAFHCKCSHNKYPLQKQFKEAFENIPDYNKMSDSDKKYLYDQMVILGMTLAVNQSQNQQNRRIIT